MAISQFEVEMMQDAIAFHHEAGENQCCTPDAPCRIVRLYTERLETNGHAGYATPVTPTEGHTRPEAGARASNQYGVHQVHAASEKQVGFLSRLLQRDLTALDARNAALVQRAADAITAGNLSKRLATDAIDVLLATTADTDAPRASEKQIAFIQRLLTERENLSRLDPENLTRLTPKQASLAINTLMAAPRLAGDKTPGVALESGMYRTPEGQIFKVYKGQSGRMLAKVLRAGEEDTFDLQSGFRHGGRVHFEYQGIATRFVTADQRMTLEDAKQFGVIYGVCCACGATLTDEESIAAGIGPVCATRF